MVRVQRGTLNYKKRTIYIHQMKNRILTITILLLVIASISSIFIINNVLPYVGIVPPRLVVEASPEDYGLLAKKLQVKTADNFLLKGYFICTSQDTAKAIIILLHGIGDCKENQLGRAKILAEAGYNSVVLDLRAHGESEGKYCTFGYYEKEDVKLFVNEITKINKNTSIGIWGNSLGGAIALQAMSIDNRITFGIIESTFDEFNKVAIEYAADYSFGIKMKWLTNIVLAKSGKIAHFSPADVKPVIAAKSITNPILFIHGALDHKIPIEFNRNNFNAVQSKEKAWITVKGAGHHNVSAAGGKDLNEKILGFVAQRLR